METAFPFVEIPEDLYPVLGRPEPGTRIYHMVGAEEESGPWFEALTDVIGPSVSPGGVSMFCPVSRAAVHKRLKESRLSAFYFETTHHATTLFGKRRPKRETALCYIPVSECKAWKAELEKEALRRERITTEELEEAKPDWGGAFLEWQRRNEAVRKVDMETVARVPFWQQLAKLKALLTNTDYEIVRRQDMAQSNPEERK